MIYELDALEEIIKTILLTSFIRESVPISAILVAPSGTAKSSMIRKVSGDFIHATDSFSSQGLWSIVQQDPKNEIHFMVVPDINPSLSRKSSTVQLAVSNLLSLTYDGTVRVDDGREQKSCKHDPVGFLSAVTPDLYNMQAKKWFALGLRRRIIPLFYIYGYETTQKLQSNVTDGKISSKHTESIILQSIPPRLPAIDNIMSMHIRALSEKFAHLLGKTSMVVRRNDKTVKKWFVETVVPVSPHLTLRTLARAHTIVRNKPKVEQEDIDFLVKFLSYCDPENPVQI